jgi:2-desacetyl-2-hydroxyethyl bacteriochlorophyllide A dehydrogenase
MEAVTLSDRREVELVDIPIPEPGRGEVLLAVELCGICGTDLHSPELDGLFTKPVVLGHEFSASIAGLGDEVDGWAEGDRVVVNPIGLVCGECEACRRGLPNQCAVALSSDCCGVGKDGGMAPFVAVDAAHLHRIDATLPAEVAAWAEPLAVAVRGVGHARIELADKVAVIGAGPIGQLVLQAAKAAGAGELLAIEGSPYRREVALACGAAETVAPDELSGRDGYDVVIDCSGAPAALDSAVDLIAPGGRIVVVGTYGSAATLSQPMLAQGKESSIAFSLCYQDRQEFDRALTLLAEGAIDVASLTTRIGALADHGAAFAEMKAARDTVKILLSPTA